MSTGPVTPLPPTVLEPLVRLLGWLAWLVLLCCIARAIWTGGQLAIRLYRDEAVEGLAGSALAAVLVGAASGIAAALFPLH
ncbi:hypothetical protein IU500_18510 [Nocardia terpenica]|uniref:hypothetical protein n=1 Tax=Nocardia terpenica TaxID=455432 RepID=UPI001895E5D9|nr:hypothetical protein [Nocardia terpenica]MBF6063479.1 hypothetical protein [Nocardia terpenica]MBF6106035.1 hypothetical protein [Nocardia terpenica]MBF6113380.1 hypothetical protein [Nocardia terpenica]MBF6119776.1 hypothetical protein [Nocardia terpenica]MBF6152187.1 hypothetical protein [Nocardia terpenica]